MAANTISVNKETIRQLLESSKKRPFLIPEYQRPYAWSEDEVNTLFDDLREFTEDEVSRATMLGENNFQEGTYFLGTIVSYLNENNEQEIIDGQQRITSIILLLRAIYTKLQSAEPKTQEAKNFIAQIEPTIWKQDKMTGTVDYSKIMITSKVIDDSGNDVLRTILETGTADENAKDNYSKNYNLFQKLYNELCQNNPLIVYNFIYCLLNCAIVLPIQADSQNTALTIFSTLNDRGMPLSDADIFKAKMYDNFDKDGKARFIREWKSLDSRASDAGETMQHLFYYYMFYLRALEGDCANTTPGIRKYFAQKKFARLKDNCLLKRLDTILNLWVVVNQHTEIENESWSCNMAIKKALDMLSAYPNEFWKYPVIVYYLTYRKSEKFENEFLLFLRKLFVEISQRYILTPTINAVKPAIVKLDTNIVKSSRPDFEFKPIEDRQQLTENMKSPLNKNIVRMLLKALAYCDKEQTGLLPDKWEVEHILPQHWQASYFRKSYSDEKIMEIINEIGNLTPFEKKLNIVAGDGYFEKKKDQYAKSGIMVTKKLTEKKEWNPESIMERNGKLTDILLQQFQLWNEDYSKQ